MPARRRLSPESIRLRLMLALSAVALALSVYLAAIFTHPLTVALVVGWVVMAGVAVDGIRRERD